MHVLLVIYRKHHRLRFNCGVLSHPVSWDFSGPPTNYSNGIFN
jgi:hypothetical protein